MAITAVTDISGLVLDLDPHEAAYQDTAGTTPASATDAVARVDDQTAGAAHVTQGTSANRPTLQADANGWLYLDCDGSNDGLSHASFTPTSGGTQPFSIVVVINVTSTSANGIILNDGTTSHLVVRQELTNQNTHFPTRLRSGTVATGLQVWDHRINGASSSLWKNGSVVIDGDAGSDAWSAGLWIGRRSDGVAWAGHIYRVLIYDKVLTNTERTDLNSYLAALYASPPPSSGNSVAFAHYYHTLLQGVGR